MNASTWTRAEQLTFCGACPRWIPQGEAMQVIRLEKITRPFIRCQFCAGGAPRDLAPFVPEQRTKRMTRLGQLTFAGVASREPGQEG